MGEDVKHESVALPYRESAAQLDGQRRMLPRLPFDTHATEIIVDGTYLATKWTGPM